MQHLRAHAVDIDKQLRIARLESGEHRLKARGLVGARHQRLRGVRQRLNAAPAAIFHVHLIPAGGAEALHGRRRDDENRGVGNDRQALPHGLNDLLPAVAVRKRLKGCKDAAHVGHVDADCAGKACERDGVLDARHIASDLLHPCHHLVGAPK